MKHAAQDIVLVPSEVSDEQRRRARLTVCDRADNIDEAREMLEALGLIKPRVAPPVSSRQAQQRRATALRRASRQTGGR